MAIPKIKATYSLVSRSSGKQEGLAERIDHVSVSRGDGLGYDIHSFEKDGRDRLIEVKTTQFGEMIPSFLSRNEVAVSEEEAARYHLFRVFDFNRDTPKVFTLSGSLRLSCLLDPVQYEASSKTRRLAVLSGSSARTALATPLQSQINRAR